MTILEYYKLTIGAAREFTKEVETRGKHIKTVWNKEHYAHHKVYEYKGNTYEINDLLGILAIDGETMEI